MQFCKLIAICNAILACTFMSFELKGVVHKRSIIILVYVKKKRSNTKLVVSLHFTCQIVRCRSYLANTK